MEQRVRERVRERSHCLVLFLLKMFLVLSLSMKRSQVKILTFFEHLELQIHLKGYGGLRAINGIM